MDQEVTGSIPVIRPFAGMWPNGKASVFGAVD